MPTMIHDSVRLYGDLRSAASMKRYKASKESWGEAAEFGTICWFRSDRGKRPTSTPPEKTKTWPLAFRPGADLIEEATPLVAHPLEEFQLASRVSQRLEPFMYGESQKHTFGFLGTCEFGQQDL